MLRFMGLAALGTGAFFVLATTYADPDLWGHLRFGLDILETHRLHSVDPYSFTSDRAWLNHEWLSEVAFAAAWQTAGQQGLIGLKLLVAFATIWLIVRTVALRGVGQDTRVLLIGLAIAGIFPRVMYVRPQIFSVLLFAALVHVLTRVEQGMRRGLVLCPVLLALWVNFHGGWVVGLGALASWALADAWVRRREGLRALDSLAWTGISTAATLINPYGVRMWAFVLQTVRPGREAIGEWGPAWNEGVVLVVWLLLAAVGGVSVVKGGLKGPASRYVLPAMWGLASLQVVRLDAFFAISVVGFLAADIERFIGRGRPGPALPLPRRIAIVALVLGGALILPASREAVSCIWLPSDEWPEPAAVAFMHANNLSGRMLTYFNWGQYAIWHVPPGVRVSMDGRRETVYSDRMISGHLQLYAATAEGIAFAETLKADYAWLPSDSAAVQALERRGWLPAFEAERSVILTAPGPGRAPDHVVEGAPAQGPRCFPGP